ncbi:DUF4145 domain-containing protein [Nocardia cyriacigeorgica]|uniref:DUF4145 domain-containing protein n=1 Tax=Nocardia cyriacigeorgica TaxID=135487 RepID=UPI001895DCC7|nr:DUF4145 domain-containing protein [Nocardia cyriacigeorgica]MBF6427829.1 DUF4145 domain-containing protein [Nocardia cyriacigeorgica]
MDDQVRLLADWFRVNNWPVLPCPVCRKGKLTSDEKHLKHVQSPSTYGWEHDSGDPADIRGILYGVLYCNDRACGEQVAVVGDYAVQRDIDDTLDNYVRVRMLHPPVPVVEVPDSVPDSIRRTLIRAAGVSWSDPSAGVALLRQSIERLMDERGIAATASNGRFRTLHQRITDFRGIESEVADLLEAVKWVGNEGSHPGGLAAVDFVEAAELVELALKLLYKPDTTALHERARRVVEARAWVP